MMVNFVCFVFSSDKLLMHTMVLMLHLNDGVINLSVFTKVCLGLELIFKCV